METTAESIEVFLSALGSPVHTIVQELGMCKLIFDSKLLKPILFSEPSPNSTGVLQEEEHTS